MLLKINTHMQSVLNLDDFFLIAYDFLFFPQNNTEWCEGNIVTQRSG